MSGGRPPAGGTRPEMQPPRAKPKMAPEKPLGPRPDVTNVESGMASVQLSEYRTDMSTHRTALSDHRTDLSEYRTDLSTQRTDMSVDRTDMSMRRTGMSFQRTRLSADRTLMSVIRTSLSLISFGFTIYQVFEKLHDSNVIPVGSGAARNFGVTLVSLGILMLLIGIVYHLQFMVGLRAERHEMVAEGLLHGQSRFPPSFTLVTALVLLLVGITAIVSMVFNIGPFGGGGT
ncbi:MAG TPA: DUF202 domain-containing protein [Devosiaceae bacterium]|jgi:uncharacterized membrane protein YidH (DUF202 family)